MSRSRDPQLQVRENSATRLTVNANPANKRHYPNVESMLVHCLRRWPNIDSTLVECLVLAWKRNPHGLAKVMRRIEFERAPQYSLVMGKVYLSIKQLILCLVRWIDLPGILTCWPGGRSAPPISDSQITPLVLFNSHSERAPSLKSKQAAFQRFRRFLWRQLNVFVSRTIPMINLNVRL